MNHKNRRSHAADVKHKRATQILKMLDRLFPRAQMVLNYSNQFQMLVAVELSAQCTDKKVNEVTATLFKKYRALSDYLHADRKEFERAIKPTGFYRNKAKNILAAARVVKKKFKGKLPKTMEEMVSIPGVGRKTANILLGNAYGVVEGIAVDTHVWRLARVLKLSSHDNPEKIEQDLMQLFPKRRWFKSTYQLIEYGRAYCTARKHNHAACPLGSIK